MKLNIQNIQSVYSGKQHRCMCGCSGKHTYAERYLGHGEEVRGYSIDADEVSDRTVKLIARKIEKAAQEGRIEYVKPDFVSAENEEGTRVWVAYFEKPETQLAETYKSLDKDEKAEQKRIAKIVDQFETECAWADSASRMVH